MAPYSIAVTPPGLPPVVAANPKREAVIDIDQTFVGTTAEITTNILRTALGAQTGVQIADLHMVIRYVHVWLAPTIGSADSVTLEDPVFNTRSTGDSSNTVRARAGFFYPKNVQRHMGPSVPGTTSVASLESSTQDIAYTARIGVTYWL